MRTWPHRTDADGAADAVSVQATARDLAKNALADLLVDTYPSLSPEASRVSGIRALKYLYGG